MSLSRKELGEGEVIAHDRHPHGKTLIRPVLALVIVTFAGSYAFFAIPAGGQASTERVAVLAVVLGLLLVLTVRPFLRWRTTSFVLTNRRIVVRTGILSRTGRDVPLQRVTDVAFTRTLPERLLGCGTLTIESAGEQSRLTLTDVPDVAFVQRELYRLIGQDRRQQDR